MYFIFLNILLKCKQTQTRPVHCELQDAGSSPRAQTNGHGGGLAFFVAPAVRGLLGDRRALPRGLALSGWNRKTDDSGRQCSLPLSGQAASRTEGQGEQGHKQDNERLAAPASPAPGLLGSRARGWWQRTAVSGWPLWPASSPSQSLCSQGSGDSRRPSRVTSLRTTIFCPGHTLDGEEAEKTAG